MVLFPKHEHDPKPHNLQPAQPIFNVEFPPERVLNIRPKSGVVIPVSTFPGWRKPHEDVPHRSHHPPESTSTSNDATYGILDGGAATLGNGTASSLHEDAILTDRIDIIQHAAKAKKYDEDLLSKAQIHEAVIANTSCGFFQRKLQHVCSPPSKEYEYGLPNNLVFLDGGGGWYARRNTTPTAELAHLFGDHTIMPSKDSSDPFVYNIYMNNPLEKEVRIVEAFTTKPDLVGLEMRCNNTADASVYYPFVGSRILPRRNNIYVATVRLFPENFPWAMLTSIHELGFLVIRTNVGLFATALDFIPNQATQGLPLKGSTDYTTRSDIHLIRDYVVDSTMKKITKPTNSAMSVIKSYRPQEQSLDSRTMFLTAMVQSKRLVKYEEEYKAGDSALRVEPSEIEFSTITSGSRIVGLPIHLANPTNSSLRIMRVSVMMKTIIEESVNITDNGPNALEVGIAYPDFPPGMGFASLSMNSTPGREDLVFSSDIIIPMRNKIQNSLNVWCKFNSMLGETISPRSYEGSIIFYVANSTTGSYENWQEELLRFGKESGGMSYVTKVDFKGSILPGAFGIAPDSLMFPTHSSMLPAMSKYSNITSTLAKDEEYYERDLEVKNNFGVPITITGMDLHEPTTEFCRNRFSTPAFGKEFRGGDWQTAMEGDKWKGLAVRYRIHDDINLGPYPQRCIMTFQTDKVGNQSLPLAVYSGSLIAEVERPDSYRAIPNCFENGKNDETSCINEWSRTTPEGSAVRNAVRDMHKKRDSWPRSCSSKRSVEHYFRSFRSRPETQYHLNPVIVPFGPVSSGSVVKRSLYLTNLNQLPVEVEATTALIGNMAISIGLAPNYTPRKLSRANKKDDSKYLLQRSTSAEGVFSKLQNQHDISLSDKAKGGELEKWFHHQRVVSNGTRFSNVSDAREMECSGGFVLSTDGFYEESFTNKQFANEIISIPAGGVARFEIAVTIQDRAVLKNDVTPFVTTGLMLETTYGQAMPIIITYSALSGELELKPAENSSGKIYEDLSSDLPPASKRPAPLVSSEPVTVEVPITLRDVGDIAPPLENGIPLSIESTFSHEILLSEVQSCNKWFTLKIPGVDGTGFVNSSSGFLRIQGRDQEILSGETPSLNFGTVYSALTCSHPSNDNSFYACALEWLEKRDFIQPAGCGIPENPSSEFDIIKAMKNDAIHAIRNVVSYLSVRYGSNASSPSTDGVEEHVKSAQVKMFEAARLAWNEVVSLGLNIVTGDISAKTLYISTESSLETSFTDEKDGNKDSADGQDALLTIPMPSVMLRSSLDIPTLFAGGSVEEPDLMKFDTVHVGEISILNVPLKNPTGMEVRVKLTAAEISGKYDDGDTGKNVFVQSSSNENHPWWTGGTYWMSDSAGSLISATHNVTIKSGAGAFVSLLNPALHTMSAFVLGCGRRCSMNSDTDNSAEEKLYSTVGAANGDNSELFGHFYHQITPEQGQTSTPHQVLSLSDPPTFSLGRHSVNEIVLPPYGVGALGPVMFRPSARRDFTGSLYIENSLTGLEEVKLHGSGGWENLVFVDDDNANDEGGDVEYRFGRSSLVFPGSSSSTKGDSVIKSFVLLNEGDLPVKINGVSMASSEVKHFTHKRRHPSVAFRPEGFFSFWYDWTKSCKCSFRGFSLLGCIEDSTSVWNPWKQFVKVVGGDTGVEGEESFENVFELLPNENKTFYIEHRPDCSFMTSYASVVFEVDSKRSRRQAFRSENVELIVGFDMNGYQLSHCIPYASPDASFWTKTISFTVPSLMCDVLSLGLTKLTDANGDPKIPNRQIKISYAVAVLILILLLMAVDLMYWSDFPPEGNETCLSWNATCRCLARADPASLDLIAIGKEQTKHVLLSRYRKERVLPSHCVSSDGSFRRDKGANAGVHNTFSDSIFKHRKVGHDSKIESGKQGVLPGGLCWRTAFSRRIGRYDIPRTSSMMGRTRELYAKHQKIQKALADNPPPPPPLASEKASAQQLNGKSDVVKQKKVNFAPAPQDRAFEHDVSNSADWVEASSFTNGKRSKSKSELQGKRLSTSAPKGKHDTVAVSSQGKKASISTDHERKSAETIKKVARTVNVKESYDKNVSIAKPKQQQNGGKFAPSDRVRTKMDIVTKVTSVPANSTKQNNIEKSVKSDMKRGAISPQNVSALKGKQARQIKKTSDVSKVAEQMKTNDTRVTSNTKQSPALSNTKTHRSTCEEKSTLPSDTRVPTNIRPPPGLSAPPGFIEKPLNLSNSFTKTVSSQLSSPIPSPTRSLSSPTPAQSIPESSSFQLPASLPTPPLNDGFSLGEVHIAPASPTASNEDIMSFLEMRHANSTPPLMHKSQSKEDVTDLLGTGNDFNISNFLDGILSDSTEQPNNISESSTHNTLVDSNPFQAVAAVPLDPWNNSSSTDAGSNDDALRTLLGSASAQSSGNDSSVIAGIPLNSGAPSLFATTIQSNNISSEPAYAHLVSDDGEKDNDTFNDPDSFYNQLLGED